MTEMMSEAMAEAIANEAFKEGMRRGAAGVIDAIIHMGAPREAMENIREAALESLEEHLKEAHSWVKLAKVSNSTSAMDS